MKIDKQALARKSHGRFCAESPPKSRSGWLWLYWILRMIGYHLPCRISILVSSLGDHDWHHRHPHANDWANGIYARQRDLENGCPGWPMYTEVWGLFEAIDAVFEHLSQLPPVPEGAHSLLSKTSLK